MSPAVRVPSPEDAELFEVPVLDDPAMVDGPATDGDGGDFDFSGPTAFDEAAEFSASAAWDMGEAAATPTVLVVGGFDVVSLDVVVVCEATGVVETTGLAAADGPAISILESGVEEVGSVRAGEIRGAVVVLDPAGVSDAVLGLIELGTGAESDETVEDNVVGKDLSDYSDGTHLQTV